MSFAVAKYRSAKTTTASPVQIVVQLYEGSLKYLRQARGCVERKDYAGKGVALRKAHAIITELQATLRPEHAPELCEQLYALYDFVLFRITETNLKNDPALLEGPLQVLGELREAWIELLTQQATAGTDAEATPAAPDARTPAPDVAKAG
ncbi:MAG: flagellar export chaperone FliS [Myxococcota bacterium]